MKKLFLISVLACLMPLKAAALNMNDPFFTPAAGQVMSDSYLGFTNNALRLGKSFGLYEKLSIGATEELTLGVSIGWADIKHVHSGAQDATIFAKYRFMKEQTDDRFLDLDVYLSPEMFRSPYNGKNGSAKGSTDFGAYGRVGTAQAGEGFTLGAKFGFDYIGHTDATKSGTIWDFGGFAKYYFAENNSFGFSADLKAYAGFEEDSFAAALGVNYSLEIIKDSFALTPYYILETNSKNIPASAVWGLNARYLF